MKIIAIGAHLDDIELACGGTLAKAVANGHQVKMIVMSDSAYTNYDGTVLRTREEAIREGTAAAKALGVDDLEILNFSTKDIPYHSEVVEALDARISAYKPDIIFTHWAFDTHQAHEGVSKATISAARYFNTILMYEPINPSGRSYVAFRPQVYIDIEGYMDIKLNSLKEHESQYKKYGERWLDAVRSRATIRGFDKGGNCAEAFEIVRMELKLENAL